MPFLQQRLVDPRHEKHQSQHQKIYGQLSRRGIGDGTGSSLTAGSERFTLGFYEFAEKMTYAALHDHPFVRNETILTRLRRFRQASGSCQGLLSERVMKRRRSGTGLIIENSKC